VGLQGRELFSLKVKNKNLQKKSFIKNAQHVDVSSQCYPGWVWSHGLGLAQDPALQQGETCYLVSGFTGPQEIQSALRPLAHGDPSPSCPLAN